MPIASSILLSLTGLLFLRIYAMRASSWSMLAAVTSFVLDALNLASDAPAMRVAVGGGLVIEACIIFRIWLLARKALDGKGSFLRLEPLFRMVLFLLSLLTAVFGALQLAFVA